ncbi:MAG: hypothetical protein HY706_08300, partial [Candidatus Hydrogenedentes bacterium]|nr:hypothetical protein [Candidatus Hydrogenedentota bacterium]
MRLRARHITIHLLLLALLALTMAPFIFVVNNSFRNNLETYHSFFGFPDALRPVPRLLWTMATGRNESLEVMNDHGETLRVAPRAAVIHYLRAATKGYREAWTAVRPYMLNSFFVCGVTAFGVLWLGSFAAYVLSRYRFPGRIGLLLALLGT